MLSNGRNSEFADAVKRNALHHKSGELKKLISAIDACQVRLNRDNLISVSEALLKWKKKDPSEMRARGGKNDAVKRLRESLRDAWLRHGQPFLLSRGNSDFERSVKRGAMHHKSSELKSLVSAVQAFQTNPRDPQAVMDLAIGWARKHPSELNHRGALLEFIVAELVNQGARLPEVAPTHATSGGDADSFIRAAHNQLTELSRLTAINLVTYARDPVNRSARGVEDPKPVPHGVPQGPWKSFLLKMYYEAVIHNGEGVCTSLNSAACHVLTQNGSARASPRVELVGTSAIRGHMFIVVGREGAPVRPGQNLPPQSDWGRGARFVDVWQSAMNENRSPYIYTTRNYTYRNQVNNRTHLYMEWS